MRGRVGFVTCVRLGLSCVEEICALGGRIEVLITLKDEMDREKSGRVYLDQFAGQHQIPLVKVHHINEEAVVQIIKEKRLDWLFIIGWSQIAGDEILNAPKNGCIGMHPSLLPEGRGRASIPWAIIKGLPKTGVTLFRLDAGTDTGDIIGQEEIPISEETTASELYEKVNEAHIRLIRNYWELIVENKVKLRRQNEEEATYWEERRPEDGEIKKEMTVGEALTLIRAVTKPYPGAFYKDGKKIWIIWSAKKGKESGLPVADGCIIPVVFEMAEEKDETER